MFKAENLTISLPYSGCNKDCPYCVSKMTGYFTNSNFELMIKNLQKAVYIARQSQVSSVLITSKGETLLNMERLTKLLISLRVYAPELPLELQTNGVLLEELLLEDLRYYHVNTVAISEDSPASFKPDNWLVKACKMVREKDMLCRLTVNMSDFLMDSVKPDELLKWAIESKAIDQLTLRLLTAPSSIVNTMESKKACQWISQNVTTLKFSDYYARFTRIVEKQGRMYYRSTDGTVRYDVGGVSVCVIPTCIQEVAGENKIRSLILQEDGHVYTSWSSSASKVI